jgi:predicted metal-dependent hydrolase
MFEPRELPAEVPAPPHAYIPGKTERHPENWFDTLKTDVTRVIRPEDLHQTRAFRIGTAYFDSGYFWECHEVLEAVWLRTDDPSPERDLIQAIIQLANARLKLLMDRPNAALRLCDMVEAHLARCAGHTRILGLDLAQLRGKVAQARDDAKCAL